MIGVQGETGSLTSTARADIVVREVRCCSAEISVSTSAGAALRICAKAHRASPAQLPMDATTDGSSYRRSGLRRRPGTSSTFVPKQCVVGCKVGVTV